MKRALLPGIVAIAFAASAASLWAHHPVSSAYVTEQQITIDGLVVELVFRNPHAFIHVAAPDRDGQPRRWAIEWGYSGTDRRLGVPTQVLRLGDRLVVSGSPAS